MTVTNEIIRVAARGDGVTADGRYVAHAAPGDVLDPSGGLIHGPHHNTPPCQHFPLCGGCQLQHLDEESLRIFIADRVTHALATQQVDIGEIMPVHLSPPSTRRRVAVRSAWAGKQLQLGFSTEKSHRIIDLRQCDVMAPQLFALLKPLRELLAPRLNRARQVQIKLAIVDQGIDVLIENWIANDLDTHEALSEFAKTHGLARLSLDEGYGPVPFWEPEPVTVTLGGVAVAYPPYGFLQATPDGEVALIAAVHQVVGAKNIIADLFAGLGTFALSLGSPRKIYAGEADREAIAGLKAAVGRAGRTIFTEHRDLFRRPLSSEELNKFEAVILDPPRAGAKEQIVQLAASKVSDIAYVSCNPASFARDAKTLVSAGYRLQRIWPVGQFRWSTHIELVGQFSR
ncbi:MAG: class I SAM-dependent RNA methyltransferase [Sphingorhabdus sp.]|uniref:class I SAM-dependent RNA methyltransferase n=1 Tax=Sphingorhabdus sp. TaxID=1902408 RepID=UPI0038FC1CCA